jgi:hypothetical protein
MKFFIFLALAAAPSLLCAQAFKTKYIFIITTDGFRWQEVFTGADSMLINDENYTADTSLAREMYWDASVECRRKKLMPFFWNVIAQKGQLFGNRRLHNKMDVKNIYKISYPGYNEILTGYADLNFIPNTPVNNKNINILETLNRQPAYSGKVVAFTSWNIFPYILNEQRSKIPVNSGYEMFEEDEDTTNHIINEVQETIVSKKHTRYDLLTYIGAREYIHAHHPKVVFLGLGETDEAAHNNKYDDYLEKASMVDKMIANLWFMIQNDPFYKDNTTFIITTDHGRGNNPATWHNHGLFTKASGETWLAIIGPDNTVPSGEINAEQQIYSNQLAATVALLLGEKFEPSHIVGKPVQLAIGIDNAGIGKR